MLPAPADGPRALDPRFAELPHLFTVVIGGLKATDPATTPIAWTRGLDLETGVWSKASPYGGKGGHIVFLAGNVAFYRTLRNSAGGELVSRDGRPTHRIRDALPVGARISLDPTTLIATDKPSQPWSERIPRWLKNTADGIRVCIMLAWPVWIVLVWLRLTVWFARSMGVSIAKARLFDHGGLAIKLTPVVLIILSVIFQT